MGSSCRRGWCALVAVLAVACPWTPDTGLNPLVRHLGVVDPVAQFPDAHVGELVRVNVQVINDGNGTTTVHAEVVPPGSPFTVSEETFQVTPGQTRPLEVVLLPVTPQDAEATLVLNHNGTPASPVTVSLRAHVLTEPLCDDHNPCTLDTPDSTQPSGCASFPVEGPCDDGNACTLQDRCVLGHCQGVARACDDGVACTVDGCDPAVGCVHTPLDVRCQDDVPCTADRCLLGIGCAHSLQANGTPCGASDCVQAALCVAGQCTTLDTPAGYPCDDGDACTVGDTCLRGICVSGTGSGPGLGEPNYVLDGAGLALDATGNPNPPHVGPPGPLAQANVVDVVGVARLGPEGSTVHGDDCTVTGQCGVPFRPDTLVLWRGDNGPVTGLICADDPARCAYGYDICTDSPPRPTLSLKLMTVLDSGVAFHVADFPVQNIMTALSNQLGTEPLNVATSVSAVRTVNMDFGMFGAALISVGGNCDCPFLDGTCIAGGFALSTFFATRAGFFLNTLEWFGPLPTVGGNLNTVPLVMDDHRLPALSLVTFNDVATVGLGLLHIQCAGGGRCTTSPCDCPSNFSAVARSFSLTNPRQAPPLHALDGAWETPVTFPGVNNGAADFQVLPPTVLGTSLFTWRQAGESVLTPPNACVLAPLRAARDWVGMFADESALAPEFQEPGTQGTWHIPTPLGLLRMTWRNTTEFNPAGVCHSHDVVTVTGNAEAAFLTSWEEGLAPLEPWRISHHASPQGSWIMMVRSDARLFLYKTILFPGNENVGLYDSGYEPASPHRLSVDAAPMVAMRNTVAMDGSVVTAAHWNINTNAGQVQPFMVLMHLGCNP